VTGPGSQTPPGNVPPPPPGYRYVPGSQYPQYRPTGDGRVAVPSWVLVGFFVFLLLAVSVLAAAAVIVLTRPPGAPDCPPGHACGGPPPSPGPGPAGSSTGSSAPTAAPAPTPSPGAGASAAPLIIGTIEPNAELGYAVVYADTWWTVDDASPRDIRLKISWREYGDPVLWIHAAPSAEMTPAQLMAEQRDQLGANVVGLVADTRPQNVIQDPEIGYQRGIGGTYTGTANSAQGVGEPVLMFFEAATNGRLSVSAVLVLEGDFTLDYGRGSHSNGFRTQVDKVLNSFAWPAP
jgi:hypothetical protein